ncbi:hypothetical protein Tco_0343494 [Tanacetum coccineum]
MAGLLFNKFKGDRVRVLLVREPKEMLQAQGEIMQQFMQGLLSVTIVKGKGIWQGSALRLRGQEIQHEGQVTQTTIPAAFQTNDLDAYDSDCDDISSAKEVFQTEVISFLNSLRELFKDFNNGPHSELNEVKMVFNQMEAAVEQYIVHTAVISYDVIGDSEKMDKSFVEAYNKCLELEAELVKKKDMIEQDVFIELSKSYSKLEQYCISLEIVMQLNQEIFQNDKSCENQNAPEFREFLENNELKAQLQAKDTTISNLNKHINSLKEKGMFRFDLEPLSPKLLKNRKAHIDYLKHTQEHAGILWEIVEHAKALQPLDSDIDSACKYATQIQELLVYVRATCPSVTKHSKKLVAVIPLNKNKKVRNEEFY